MKKRAFLRIIALALISIMMLSMTLSATVTLSAASPTTTLTVPFVNPAIPANAGETVDLSSYAAELTSGNVTAADKITWSSSELTVSAGKVTPSAKGVYKLSATNGTATKAIYLVVKNAGDSDYVLYENDFSNAAAISDFTLDSTGAATNYNITNGKLVLDTTADKYAGGRVLLPEWLGDFGNYKISTNATITSCKDNDGSRWMAVMYRFQPTSNKPNWYQMAIRQNASSDNGMEISYRQPDGNWNVLNKQAYSSALSSGTYYSFEITVAGKSITQTINGNAAGNLSSSLTHIQTGRVGLGGAGCVASFDDIKVTVNLDSLKPVSGITLTPTMAYEINSSSALNSILTDAPDVAIMTMNGSGNILASDNSTICSLSDAVSMLQGKSIPALRLSKDSGPSTAATKINALNTDDVMIISDKSSYISTVRGTNSRIIGVLDLSDTDLSNKKLWEIRAMVLKCGARICILPTDMATQRLVSDLNTMGVTVWFETKENSQVEMFSLITSGANGIITLDRKLMNETLLSPIFKENSIIRPVGVIGHRGTPALAPELTIAGSSLAATNGANIIENDLYITTDGVVVVSHDNSVATITNGTGNVEDHDLEWFKQWVIDDAPGSDLNNPQTPSDRTDIIDGPLPVATLEDYFECFKGTDTFMFLEIKSGQSEKIVKAMKALIDEYDIADQCGVIAFGDANIRAVRQYMPELSVGKLTGALGSVDNVANTVTALESSYNPNGNETFIDSEIVRGLANRGIFTWPWTINSSDKFDQYLLTGVGGITTDHSYWAEDYVRFLLAETQECEVILGTDTKCKLTLEYYGAAEDDGTFANAVSNASSKAEVIHISGNKTVKYENGKFTATQSGDAAIIFRYAYTLNNGAKAYVYSQPVVVHAMTQAEKDRLEAEKNTEPVEPTPTPEASDTAPIDAQATEPTDEKSGCGSAIGATASVASVLVVGTMAIIKRKKKD